MKVAIRRRNLINKMRRINLAIKFLRNGMYACLGSAALVIIACFIMGTMVTPLFVAWALSILGINVTHDVLVNIRQSYTNSISDLSRRFGYLKMDELYIDNVEIIPRDICIGENLEASNAFDVFKKGNYVLIKTGEEALIFKEYEDDEEQAHVLEELTDQDMELFMEGLSPKQLECVKQLKYVKPPEWLGRAVVYEKD